MENFGAVTGGYTAPFFLYLSHTHISLLYCIKYCHLYEVIFWAFVIILSFLFIDYSVFLIRNILIWNRQKTVTYSEQADIPFTSIIIAARNEEKKIARCLNSIVANSISTSSYEIIVVDDHSSDDTVRRVEELNLPNVRIISLRSPDAYGKKEALRQGVHQAKGDYLLFTDADTVVPHHWIITMIKHICTNHLDLVTGPINVMVRNSLLSQFETLDVAGTMIWTGAGIWSKSHYLANGANLAVRHSVYKDHQDDLRDDMASGDDVFLIQAVAADHPDKLDFLKSQQAIVKVDSVKSIKELFSQRVRWASKTNTYHNSKLKNRIATIFLFNFLLLATAILGSVDVRFLWLFLIVLTFKAVLESFYLRVPNRFFGLNIKVRHMIVLSLFQSIYILLIGVMTTVSKKYRWKDREISIGKKKEESSDTLF